MANTTTFQSYLTAPVNYVLMKGLLQAIRKKCPYFNGTLPGELVKNGGSSSVKWERINNLTAVTTSLGEVATSSFLFGRSLVTPTYSVVTATAAKYGNAIQPTEEIDLFNVNTRAVKLLDTLGANAAESLNTLIKNQAYDGATIARYSIGAAGGAGTSSKSYVTSKMAAVDIQYATNQLNENAAMPFTPLATGSKNIGTVPVRVSYYGICHVDVEEDIRGISGFIPVEQYGGYTETMPFEFGAANGVRWCSTQIATINKSAGKKTASGYRGSSTTANDVYTSYVYGRESVGTVGLGNMHADNAYEMYNPKNPPAVEIIYKPAGSAGAGDPYNEVASLAWKTWFVSTVLNTGWIVKIFTLASKL